AEAAAKAAAEAAQAAAEAAARAAAEEAARLATEEAARWTTGEDGISRYIVTGSSTGGALLGSSTSESISAMFGNNQIYAGGGADCVTCGGGSDVIYGEDGDDILNGGAGADYLDAGPGNDRIDINSYDVEPGEVLIGGEGSDTLNVITNVADFRNASRIEEFEALQIGADQKVRFHASQLQDQSWDIYDSNGVEGITVYGADGADDIRLNQLHFKQWGQQKDTIEIIAGGGDDTVNATSADALVWGGDGNDSLYGGAGADTLMGEAGNDTLVGGAGADSLVGGDGADVVVFAGDAVGDYIGADGQDTLLVLASTDFRDVANGPDNDPLNGYAMAIGAGQTAVIGNDKVFVQGCAFYGNATPGTREVLEYHGRDTGDYEEAAAWLGTTFVNWNPAEDLLIMAGGAGDDWYSGSSYDDCLLGGVGDDTLAGGAGADTLVGGAGQDVYKYVAPSDGGDVIADFSHADDQFSFDTGAFASSVHFKQAGAAYDGSNGAAGAAGPAFVFETGTGKLWYDANGDAAGGHTLIAAIQGDAVHADDLGLTILAGGSAITGTSGNDTLTGTTDGDTVIGLAGDDSLVGLGGDDCLVGGDGADTLAGGAGHDTLVAGDGGGLGFSGANVVSSAAGFPNDVRLADLDGDGDLDILASQRDSGSIAWCANDGAGTFGAAQTISAAVSAPQHVHAADLDGDGDLDVLSASCTDNKIAWYANDGNGNFGAQQVLTTSASFAMTAVAADLDGDCDLDVLIASRDDNTVSWFENLDGHGSFGAEQVISSTLAYAFSALASDVDQDGDLDVIAASATGNQIVWYENIDGAGTFGAAQVITTDVLYPQRMVLADLDDDGFLDLVSTSRDDGKIAYYFGNGSGFGPQQVVEQGVRPASDIAGVHAADLDGDGDLDLLATGSEADRAVWFEHLDHSGAFGAARSITLSQDDVRGIVAGDLDGDGDPDVLVSSVADNTIAWYANKAADDHDVLSYADGVDRGHGMEVDLTAGFASDTLSGGSETDSIAGFNHVAGTAYADALRGNALGNTLVGGAGDDTLAGGAGADSLLAGDGDDVLLFDGLWQVGAGEHLDGGAGFDTLQVADCQGAEIKLAGTFANIEAVRLGYEATAYFSFGQADGATWTVYGPEGPSELQVYDQHGDTHVDLSSLNFNGSFAGGSVKVFSLASDDEIAGSSWGDFVASDDGADTVLGMAGDDTLSGEWGNDSLVGGEGTDCLLGGDGDDTLKGDAGADTLDGGSGADVYYYGFSGDGGDLVLSFEDGSDVFRFNAGAFDSGAGFTSFDSGGAGYDGANAGIGNSSPTFLFDTSQSKLYYDSNGDDTGGSEFIAAIEEAGSYTMDASDIQVV
ncbi:MAG: FG-GAP-like repeat-containing protein, partial [Thermodesulfobacteriota bacterium]